MGITSLRNLKTFDSFKNPVYRLYYLSTAAQWASGSMQMVARSLLVYRITGSGAILGSLALAQALPLLFLSLFGGVIADRTQKKHVLLFGQASAIFVALGIGFSLSTGYLSAEHAGSWWVLLVAALLQGITGGLTQPSRAAIIREIVRDDQVMNAVSLSNMGQNAFQLLGPAVGGLVLEAFGFTSLYFIMSGIYLISVACLVLMPRTRTITIGGSNLVREISEGFRYVRRETPIMLVLLFALISSVLGMPIIQILPIFTEDILKVGATGLGLLMSATGLGALVGSLVFASLPSRKRGLIFLLSGVGIGIALISFSLSNWWLLSLVLIVVYGLARTGKVTLENALLQSYAQADYRGRVMSLLTMQMSFASFGVFFAGILAEVVGVQWAIGGLAGVLTVVSLLMWAFTPKLRDLD
ncbi:MFS transporter [Chloroflexota bacterium]